MTTIIIIVVVALVFFVTVCVVTFMVWKREAEMRTDSIRAIESNLEKLGDKLEKESRQPKEEIENAGLGGINHFEKAEIQRSVQHASRRRQSKDPFDWVRESSEYEEPYTEPETWHGETKRISPGDIDSESINVPEKMECNICTKSTDALQTTENEHYNNEYYEDAGDPKSYTEEAEVNLSDIPEMKMDEIRLPDIELEDIEIQVPEQFEEPETRELEEDEPEYAEINLDFEIPQESQYRFERQEHKPFGHDVGRSGKKYTSEELDVLIKE